MPRYVRLGSAPSTANDGGADWTDSLRYLAPVSSLAKLAGGLTDTPDLTAGAKGLSGLASLVGGISTGNPVQALGGAAGLGSGLASLADMPMTSAGLGAVGGPLAFGSSLAKGNYGGAAASLPSLAATGAQLGGMTGLIAPATASAIGGIASTVALPVALTAMAAGGDSHGEDFFDVLFGNGRDRMKEYRHAQEALPSSWNKMVAGAGTLGGTYDTPEAITDAFKIANEGQRAVEFSPAFTLIQNGQGKKNPGPHDNPKPYIPGHPMPELEAAAPGVSADNWASWLNLADKAQAAGVDWMPLAGGSEQKVPVSDYQRSAIDLRHGENTPNLNDPFPVQPYQAEYTDPTLYTGGADRTTQEAYDLSRAVAGLGTALGIDSTLLPGGGYNDRTGDYAPGAEERYRGSGSYFAPEQLGELGFTPGSYTTAAANWLKGLDPSVTEKDLWKRYGLG